jgi:hypothetical protein
MLTLLKDLALLADHLAAVREAQARHHQADAARSVARVLRSAVAAGGRFGQPAVSLLDLTVAAPSRDDDEMAPDVSTRDGRDRASRR